MIQSFNNLQKTYQVNDLLQESTKFIFVLESPHKKELEHGCPVAGGSGKTMSAILIKDSTEPFGIALHNYILNSIGDSKLSEYGIMNICPIPMQKTSYSEDTAVLECDFIKVMEEIRSGNKKRFTEEQESLFLLLKENFLKRMQTIETDKVIFVPCGNFARSMFSKITDGIEGLNILDKIPHPSYNSWRQVKYKGIISDLEDKLSIE